MSNNQKPILNNQKGQAPVLLLIGIVGVVAFLLIFSYAPLKNNLLSSIFPKDESQAATTWAFSENWDSFAAPTAPINWQPSNFNLMIDQQDGQEITSDPAINPSTPIEAGHGPQCQPPIGNADPSLNNHILPHSETSGVDWLKDVRPQIFYICNGHMMSVVKSGYAVAGFIPRQIFDWTDRAGVIEFDANPYSWGRNWWDLYIVPQDEMLLNIQQVDEGGTGELLPKRAVLFSFNANTPHVDVIDNYQKVYTWKYWQQYGDAFPNDPAMSDPKIRRKFRFQLSQTSWKFEIQKDDGTFWSHSGTFDTPLSFSKGLINMEHHSYNPTKEPINANPWSQWTYHWDNFQFDGPVVPDRTAFEPVNRKDYTDDGGPAIVVNIPHPPSQLRNPVIIGQATSQLNGVDATNTSRWRQFRINGGPWQDLTLVKNVAISNLDRGGSTFRNSITGLVQGNNTIEFRQNGRPSGASWQQNGFSITDVEIQVDPMGLPSPSLSPSTQPSPSITPSPSLAPSPSPSRSPSPSPSASPSLQPSPTPTPSPSLTPSPSAKPGDIDGNNKVDIFDYNILLTNFGKTGSGLQGDFDKNNKVDIFDYNTLLGNFGK